MRRLLIYFLTLATLAGCVTTPENYRPAGFNTIAEARSYVPEYLYFARKLTAREWEEFYARFPEYWKDLQAAKMIGSTLEYHPMYTAYSFRWNTLRRKAAWPPETIARLERAEVAAGDDVFQISYAIGAPERIIWDNDFEVLIYRDRALVMEHGRLGRAAQCQGCHEQKAPSHTNIPGMTDAMVLQELGLKRPSYRQ